MKRSWKIQWMAMFAALLLVPVPPAPAQAPTDDELKELERQAAELEMKRAAAEAEAQRRMMAEKKTAEAKRRAEASKKAAADAKRIAEQKFAAERQKIVELAGKFVDIRGGTFEMGCSPEDPNCEDDERPAHTVSIKAFRIGKAEVTVGNFRRFVEATTYRTDAEREGHCWALGGDGKWAEQAGRNWTNPGFTQSDRHPVVCVSWNDATAYVQWLSQQGLGRFRLPSESEWEYVARSGRKGFYGFGDKVEILCDYANIADKTAAERLPFRTVGPCDDREMYTASVGGYRPNRYGIHDLHGNVWEWMEDCWHDSYTGAPSDGTPWLVGDCARRVLRGGSWGDDPMLARSSYRDRNLTQIRGDNVGFRLVHER
jgi:formylglycine-generating enzyme required for sulfatase activity